MSKEFWKAAFTRALRTVSQSLLAQLPVGITITVKQLETMDVKKVFLMIAAWLLTGLAAGGVSILEAIATGLPEVEK